MSSPAGLDRVQQDFYDTTLRSVRDATRSRKAREWTTEPTSTPAVTRDHLARDARFSDIRPRRVDAGDRRGTTVQRYAFIKGKLMENDEQGGSLSQESGYSPEMLQLVDDDQVRDFDSVDELRLFAQESTDYIGNIPEKDGLWVRFNPKGLNILGEKHSFLPLPVVTRAVGSRNFIHEAFTSVDDMGLDLPRTQGVVDEIAMIRHQEFGTQEEVDKRRFAAESLLPKMGFAINWFDRYLPKFYSDVSRVPSENVDDALLKNLKIAHTFVDELATQELPEPLQFPSLEPLLEHYDQFKTEIQDFVTPLKPGQPFGLGQAETAAAKSNFGTIKILSQFSLLLMGYLRDVLQHITPDYRYPEEKLAADKKEKEQHQIQYDSSHEREVFFRDLRAQRFLESVMAAQLRGVRYAGMGNKHLKALLDVGIEKFGQPYVMRQDGEAYTAFKSDTDAMKDVVKKRQAEISKPQNQ